MENKRILIILITCILILSSCQNQKDLAENISSQTTQVTYTSYGANQSVSGAMHVLGIGELSLMLDAGLFYGDDIYEGLSITEEIVQGIDTIIISHAHLDHSVRLI